MGTRNFAKSPVATNAKFAENLTDDGMVGQQVFMVGSYSISAMTEEAKEGEMHS
jgi:1,4-dihydroxy-2-naphthoyl-CoA synthase